MPHGHGMDPRFKPPAKNLERQHQDRMGTGAFFVGLAGFYVLLNAPLTGIGMAAVVAVTALLCWLLIAKA